MYEITVAFKYLIPRWRQLSVSVISLISILVISLVVWLIVVFFSVTHGLEKSWVQKMIALSAPVRVTPTDEYYRSFYYLSDSISSESDYSLKSIGEKQMSDTTIAYDPSVDEAIPDNWNKVEVDSYGKPKDLVKEVYSSIRAINHIPGIEATDYEMTVGNLHLQMGKQPSSPAGPEGAESRQNTFMNQSAYLGSFEWGNQYIRQSLLPLTSSDIEHILETVMSDSNRNKSLEKCLGALCVNTLKTGSGGWIIPNELLPYLAKFNVIAIFRQNIPVRLLLPENSQVEKKLTKQLLEFGYDIKNATLSINNGRLDLEVTDGGEKIPLSNNMPIVLSPDVVFDAKVDAESAKKALTVNDLLFQVEVKVQGHTLRGTIPKANLKIDHFSYLSKNTPFWLEPTSELAEADKTLPSYSAAVDGILLPKNYRASGVHIGDIGYISYYSATATTVQEQRAPVYVAGFYDPGIVSMGGKFIITNIGLINLIRTSYENKDQSFSANGIHVRFNDLKDTEQVKIALNKEFVERGIDRYWKVESYKEYDYTKDLIQQLKSEKNLFSILSTIIIIVACSNIISMLIILVNDKRTEIGILRAMGASSKSIALIFGICGIVMGLMGSVVGIVGAKITLSHLNELIEFISQIQGHQMFNPLFYGDTLPNELSQEALLFVMAATAGISLIAGIVPAIKACTVNPATILRSE